MQRNQLVQEYTQIHLLCRMRAEIPFIKSMTYSVVIALQILIGHQPRH